MKFDPRWLLLLLLLGSTPGYSLDFDQVLEILHTKAKKVEKVGNRYQVTLKVSDSPKPGIPHEVTFDLEKFRDEKSPSTFARFSIRAQTRTADTFGFSCFDFDIIADRTAYFAGLSSEVKNCPDGVTLSKGKGTYLLGLGDELNKVLSLHETSLKDESTLSCFKKKDGKLAGSEKLALVHMIQKGQTWYESIGYRPKTMDYVSYRKQVDLLRNMDLQTAWKEVEKETKYLRLASLTEDSAKKMMDEFLSSRGPLKEAKLHEFLDWIWNNHCEVFRDFKTIFFVRSTKSRHQWVQNYQEFERGHVFMVKKYPQTQNPKSECVDPEKPVSEVIPRTADTMIHTLEEIQEKKSTVPSSIR
jgi:hypothetical protein